MDLLFQIGLVFLLIFLNGYFVASEFALVSVRETRIDQLIKKGNRTALLVKKALTRLDTYISSTQLGITAASIGLGWAGEPMLAHILEPLFTFWLPVKGAQVTAHAAAVAIAFSSITFLHIVLGELIPKTISLQRAERTSLLIIAPLLVFTTIFRPFIWLLNAAGNMALKVVGFPVSEGHQLAHSEEEIKLILAQSAKDGAIKKEEAQMVYSVFRFGDIPVRNIMIPKSRMIAFEEHMLIEQAIAIAEKNLHSRFPVYRKTIHRIAGFIHVKDLYRFSRRKRIREKRSIADAGIIRQILSVSQKEKIDTVLLRMKNKHIHIAAVGAGIHRTAGIVTLEDVLENLVGDIHDEFGAA